MLPTPNDPCEARFWARVCEDDSGCWLFTGADNGNGYGAFYDSSQKRQRGAHRFAYERVVGTIPAGLTLDHLCRVRRCVNPSHLEPVSNLVNVMRGEGVGARASRQTHCINGHELPDFKTRSKRVCVPCNRRYKRDYMRRVRAQEKVA